MGILKTSSEYYCRVISLRVTPHSLVCWVWLIRILTPSIGHQSNVFTNELFTKVILEVAQVYSNGGYLQEVLIAKS